MIGFLHLTLVVDGPAEPVSLNVESIYSFQPATVGARLDYQDGIIYVTESYEEVARRVANLLITSRR